MEQGIQNLGSEYTRAAHCSRPSKWAEPEGIYSIYKHIYTFTYIYIYMYFYINLYIENHELTPIPPILTQYLRVHCNFLTFYICNYHFRQ